MAKEIEWASRVDPKWIRRLYASDAKNIQDSELADEVGYGLYAWAVSLIKVNRAHHESIIDCPSCGNEVSGGVSAFVCNRGWNMTKEDYHLTYRRKQLVAVSIVPVAEKFMSDWERAKESYQAKMQAIDYLIHCFHYELEDDRKTVRPAVVNFIDCNVLLAIELIFELAYGNGSKEPSKQLKRWFANAQSSHLNELINAKEKEAQEKFRLP